MHANNISNIIERDVKETLFISHRCSHNLSIGIFMLTWDEEVKPSLPKDLQQRIAALIEQRGDRSPRSSAAADFANRTRRCARSTMAPHRAPRSCRFAAAPHPPHAPRQRRRQAHHQRPDRRQPAGAVQVQVGLGKVPRHLRQPLDAAGSEHDARHRALERPERPDRRRAPHRQAQPRLLRDRRFAGRQQHRAGHLPPHHGARVPPVPAAPGVRGSDPHARLPVHRRVARPGRERDLQRLQRSASRSARRTSS